jgi:hypothetical protein
MEQTAVEWYEKEINSLFEKYEAKQISQVDFLIMKHNIFYPAKEMEKEQIINAYADGINHDYTDLDIEFGIGNSDREYHAEKYYNETYGKK